MGTEEEERPCPTGVHAIKFGRGKHFPSLGILRPVEAGNMI